MRPIKKKKKKLDLFGNFVSSQFLISLLKVLNKETRVHKTIVSMEKNSPKRLSSSSSSFAVRFCFSNEMYPYF